MLAAQPCAPRPQSTPALWPGSASGPWRQCPQSALRLGALLDRAAQSTGPTQLRIHGGHAEDARPTQPSVEKLLAEETRRGMTALPVYQSFQARADQVKDGLLRFLLEQKRAGKKVAAYGAAAKGNTLLN